MQGKPQRKANDRSASPPTTTLSCQQHKACAAPVLHWLPVCRHQPCRCCGGSQWLRIMRSEFSMHKHTRQYPRPCSCQINPQLARQQRAQQPMGCTASAAAAIRHTLAASSMQPAALPIARHSCHSRPLHLITAPHLSPVLSPAPLFHSPALAPRVLHTRRPYTGRHSGKPPRGQCMPLHGSAATCRPLQRQTCHAAAWQHAAHNPQAEMHVDCWRMHGVQASQECWLQRSRPCCASPHPPRPRQPPR